MYIYGCFPNMGSIISSHNKHALNSNRAEFGCNCNNGDECPLENKYLTAIIVYRADATNNKILKTQILLCYLRYSIQRTL